MMINFNEALKVKKEEQKKKEEVKNILFGISKEYAEEVERKKKKESKFFRIHKELNKTVYLKFEKQETKNRNLENIYANITKKDD